MRRRKLFDLPKNRPRPTRGAKCQVPVERDGIEIRLTTKEYAVLEVLMRADGAFVSAEDLLERAWDENADPFTATVRVTIATLRSKLGHPPVVETLIGTGYRIKALRT